MNPLINLVFIAIAAIAVILVIALACSVFILSAGKRYSEKLFAVLREEILALMPGKECEGCEGCQKLVEKMIDEGLAPDQCPELPAENKEKIAAILAEYRAEQDRIRKSAEENQKNRPKKGRVLKFLTEKKDKGEWT